MCRRTRRPRPSAGDGGGVVCVVCRGSAASMTTTGAAGLSMRNASVRIERRPLPGSPRTITLVFRVSECATSLYAEIQLGLRMPPAEIVGNDAIRESVSSAPRLPNRSSSSTATTPTTSPRLVMCLVRIRICRPLSSVTVCRALSCLDMRYSAYWPMIACSSGFSSDRAASFAITVSPRAITARPGLAEARRYVSNTARVSWLRSRRRLRLMSVAAERTRASTRLFQLSANMLASRTPATRPVSGSRMGAPVQAN